MMSQRVNGTDQLPAAEQYILCCRFHRDLPGSERYLAGRSFVS